MRESARRSRKIADRARARRSGNARRVEDCFDLPRANLGFTMSVVCDATFTFDRQGMNGRVHPAEEVHQVALASLSEEFAHIASTDDLLR
jgi:hypothetical protein